MLFKLDYKLFPEALRITIFSVIVSWILTIVVTLALVKGPKELVLFLQVGLSIATVVPVIVALPISYYVLKSRQEVKEVNQKLAHLLRFDQLTSLLSRRAFFQEVETALERFLGGKQSNAVFFLDLDHFKKINDQFGHAMGDEVLRLLGKIVNDYLQPGEIAGRMGGEEFCIFALNCPPKQALSRAQLLVDDFRRQAKIVDGKEMGCTLSVGVAVSTDAHDLDKLIKEADRLLYIAKQGGRDCVAIDDDQQIAALTNLLDVKSTHLEPVKKARA